MLTSRCAGGACNAGWADAEAHLGLGVLNHVIDVAHHHVDVVAAPVGKGHVHAGIVPQVVVAGTAVGGNAVGIEVVVKHDTVHIIVGDDLTDDVDNALTRLGQAGIEDGRRAAAVGVGEQHARVLEFLVLGRIPVGARTPAIGIDPRVALDAAGMALLDDILQRVVARILATGSGQVTRPGLVTRLVHRITHRAHLKEDGIEVLRLQVVEIGVDLSLLGSNIIHCRRPVDGPDGGNPRCTHLTLAGLLGTHRYRSGKDYG